MITSLHNSIHLTERETVLLRRCMCPSGRIINIKTNGHTQTSHPTVCICQRATALATTTATTINCVDSTHATFSPYGKRDHIQLYTIYRMTTTVFSWGTPQQQQQFLMTTYMPLDHSLCSCHSTQRPPDGFLSAWRRRTPRGCTERD